MLFLGFVTYDYKLCCMYVVLIHLATVYFYPQHKSKTAITYLQNMCTPNIALLSFITLVCRHYIKTHSCTVIPQFTSLIHSSKIARKAKIRTMNTIFPLLATSYVLTGSRGQKLLHKHMMLLLIQPRMVPKCEKNVTIMVNYYITFISINVCINDSYVMENA